MTVTVVGGGIGGFSTAKALRDGGFGEPIRIVDPDPLPYDRPPLSKEYLAGTASADHLLLTPASWYADNDVEFITGTASVDGDRLLVDGRPLDTDLTVLATGGTPRRLHVPGGDDPRLLTLRSRADADRLRAALVPEALLLVVGAGLIGAEVASTARTLGVEVTLVDPDPLPLATQIGPELAQLLHDQHATHGVSVHHDAVTGLSDGRGVVLRDGTRLDADVVLVAVGIEAHRFAVDAAQRTERARTWAVGDAVAGRPEHWDSAVQQAQTAAADILGVALPAPAAPWFWSDRYGRHLEAIGDLVGPGRTVLRGDSVAFRLSPEGALTGAASVDEPMAVRAARRLLQQDKRPDPDALADPAVPFRQLTRAEMA